MSVQFLKLTIIDYLTFLLCEGLHCPNNCQVTLRSSTFHYSETAYFIDSLKYSYKEEESPFHTVFIYLFF